MDQVTAYKNFLSGRHFAEGLRTTVGVVIPCLLMSYSGQLGIGFLMSAGALCVSITDTPGPAKYRLTGMLACVFFIVVNVIFSGWLQPYPWLLGAFLLVVGFFFSMLGVYGLRTGSIGVAAILVVIFTTDKNLAPGSIYQKAIFFGIGGTWYMLYSLLMHRIRPYKIIQQVLGDYILGIAGYLRVRGGFYEGKDNHNEIYQQLLKKQIEIEREQQLLNELIFKTRATLKDSNHTARVLLKMYLDVTDMFESVMTTYHEYGRMHDFPQVQPIIKKIKELIHTLSDEWVDIGVAIKTNQISVPSKLVPKMLDEIKVSFDQVRTQEHDKDVIEILISMGRIIENIQDLHRKTKQLHELTTYDRKIQTSVSTNPDFNVYPLKKNIKPSIFINNLNFKSGIFRHSLRVALALLTGFIITHLFDLRHGNWILLTILVIMKPAYSLTKQRNMHRLIGTIIGLVCGALILYFIKNEQVLLMIMIFCMLMTFSLVKTNYLWAVIFMTPELMILFSVLFSGDTQLVLTDRLIDTIIGSGIAGVFSLFVLPSWEQHNIHQMMLELLKNDKTYFKLASDSFTGVEVDEMELSKVRRQSFIALANLGDAFNRMLSEPKQYQQDMEKIHRFVVLSYSLTSHITTLLYLKKQQHLHPVFVSLGDIIDNTIQHLDFVEASIKGEKPVEVQFHQLEPKKKYIDELVERRKEEIRNGILDSPLKAELITVKSVIDQFQYIQSLAIGLARIYR